MCCILPNLLLRRIIEDGLSKEKKKGQRVQEDMQDSQELTCQCTPYLHLVKFTRFEKFCGTLNRNAYKNQTTPWELMGSEKHDNLMNETQNTILDFIWTSQMFLQHGMMMLAWSVSHCNPMMRNSHTLNLDDKRLAGIHDETPQSANRFLIALLNLKNFKTNLCKWVGINSTFFMCSPC